MSDDVNLLTHARVERLETDASGRSVSEVVLDRRGRYGGGGRMPVLMPVATPVTAPAWASESATPLPQESTEGGPQRELMRVGRNGVVDLGDDLARDPDISITGGASSVRLRGNDGDDELTGQGFGTGNATVLA
jgi:hypothetical protein